MDEEMIAKFAFVCVMKKVKDNSPTEEQRKDIDKVGRFISSLINNGCFAVNLFRMLSADDISKIIADPVSFSAYLIANGCPPDALTKAIIELMGG